MHCTRKWRLSKLQKFLVLFLSLGVFARKFGQKWQKFGHRKARAREVGLELAKSGYIRPRVQGPRVCDQTGSQKYKWICRLIYSLELARILTVSLPHIIYRLLFFRFVIKNSGKK